MKQIKTIANCQPVCDKCAFAYYVKVSKQVRPLVEQWVEYGVAIVPDTAKIHCIKCHRMI